jgi:hypothetical protein
MAHNFTPIESARRDYELAEWHAAKWRNAVETAPDVKRARAYTILLDNAEECATAAYAVLHHNKLHEAGIGEGKGEGG